MLESAAQSYLAAGLSVLPARRAEKRPAIGRWKAYQARRPTDAELLAWLANGPDGLCIICGAISGNLEIIDFDSGGELFDAWRQKIPCELYDRLVVETTPSGGYHVIYRSTDDVSGNLKLAQRKTDSGIETLIETRGEGGLFLCAPTLGYECTQGDLSSIPTLSQEQRLQLLEAAWALNEYIQPVPASHAAILPSCSDRPGDAFNQHGDVRAILQKHGWQKTHEDSVNEYYRRPGKTSGHSASLRKEDRTFVNFSSNAPFEPYKGYSPFHVLVVLDHDGDFTQAAQSLVHMGYGGHTTTHGGECADLSGIMTQCVRSEEASPKRRYIRFDQIEIKPPEWLLHGILERDSTAMIFGDPGCGKSFVAIDWACRIATGTSWRGHPVTPAPVAYILGEGQAGLGRRIQAWQEHNGVSLAGAPIYMARAIPMPDRLELMQLIEDTEREIGNPELVVIDTLARNFGGGDENSTQDMTQFVAACDAVRERFGCTILIVHHTGHGEKNRARGAMALKAALDAEYLLTQADRLLLTATKMKDAETPDPVTMNLCSVELPGLEDEYGRKTTSAAIEVVSAQIGSIMTQEVTLTIEEFVAHCIEPYDPCSRNVIAYHAQRLYGMSSDGVQDRLTQAMEKEKLCRIGSASGRKYVVNRPGCSGEKAAWAGALLTRNPDASIQAIAEEVGISRQHVYRVRNTLDVT